MAPVAMLLLLAASLGAGDVDAPSARIDFPLPSALTDRHSIRVRGAAVDASGVAAVRVNGVPASTVDGYATWWALVPLEPGPNEVVVETLDALGNLDPAAATTVVRRDGVLIGDLGYLAVDTLGARAFVLDQARDTPSAYAWARVLGVDLLDGSLSVVSSRSVGSGALNNLNTGLGEMDWDAFGGRLIAANAFPGELIAIDVASGDRSVIAGPDLGSGPSLYASWGLELDPNAPRAWLLHSDWSGAQDQGAILEVDLTTGDRRLLALESDGTTPWPNAPGRLDLLPGGQRLAFCEKDVVTAVDVVTGAQTLLSQASLGLAEHWEYLRAFAADPYGRAWAAAPGQQRVYALDPQGGAYAPVLAEVLRTTPGYVDLEVDPARARLLALDASAGLVLSVPHDGSTPEVLARNSIGGGYSLDRNKLSGFALEGDRRVYLIDRPRREILSVEIDDGERRLVSGPTQGAGDPLAFPEDIVLDDSAGAPRLIVMDREVGGLVAVDPASGDRSLVSGPGVGDGEPFVLDAVIALPFLRVDRIGGTAFVVDFGSAWFERRLLAVDLASGDRTLVSGDGVGAGPLLVDGNDLAIDRLRGRALVAAQKSIQAVDLASGERSQFSGPLVGSGPGLVYVNHLAWDAQADRLLIVEIDGKVISVDGATGDRTLLYSRDVTKGPGFAYGIQQIALLRPPGGAAPLLLYGDTEVFGVGVLDLAADPASGLVPGHHAILSR